MKKSHRIDLLGLLALVLCLTVTPWLIGQNPNPGTGVPVQMVTAYYPTTPISNTAAVNNATVLTIPAPPPGQYNYICSLALNITASNTGAVVMSNVTGSSTNFNSWADKVSFVGTANTTYDMPQEMNAGPGSGCAKSTLPGTATTFTAPAPGAQNAATWSATFYQAP